MFPFPLARVLAGPARYVSLALLIALLPGCEQEPPQPSESVAQAMADTPMAHAVKHLA